MIESLKGWVTNICTAIFFITAVEMILPSNSMKKYTKFVLGLILITVVINPIIKFFNNDFNVQTCINTASTYFEEKDYKKDYYKYKKDSIDSTTKVFCVNLENLCIEKLKEKYPKDNYEVLADVDYEKDKGKFNINKLKIGVKEGKVQKIKKINIKNSAQVSNCDEVDNKKAREIIEYLSETINITKDKIKLYKL